MIIGVFLVIGIAVFLASVGFILFGMLGTLKVNLMTGAVIGPGEMTSYAAITLAISFIAIALLVLKIKKQHEKVKPHSPMYK